MSRNSRIVMLQSQSSITVLSKRAQPAGSISRRASDTKVAPRLTHGSRLTMSVRVVPPIATSALRTTSSTLSTVRTGMPSLADHLVAKASRVSGRRDVQTISSKRYMCCRQRRQFSPMVPTPTRPSVCGAFGPRRLRATMAAAALRIA